MNRSYQTPTNCPYKGLIPYSEEDRLFFFGREKDQERITDCLTTRKVTILYGASAVGKSSLLSAGVANNLHQIAQERANLEGKPGWTTIVFPSRKDVSWQDPIAGIQKQLEAKIKDLGVDNTPSDNLSFVDTLKEWVKIVQDKEGIGRLFIILDQFEEYFVYLSQKEGKDAFAEEFPKAVNDPELSANFMISIREDSLSKLDYFKRDIPDLLKYRLQLKHLDKESASDAIEKPVYECNRQQIILNSLYKERLTILSGDRDTYKSTRLRLGIANDLEQQGAKFLFFNDWHKNEKILTQLKQKIANKFQFSLDNSLLPLEPSLSEMLQQSPCCIGTGTDREECKLFIILDQFEEYFRNQKNGKEDFMQQLIDTINDTSLDIHFLISIRENYLNKLRDIVKTKFSEISIKCLYLYKETRKNDGVNSKRIEKQIERITEIILDPYTCSTQPIIQIDIDPELNDLVLKDFENEQKKRKHFLQSQAETNEPKSEYNQELRFEAPYLQLVMTRLWKEEIERIEKKDRKEEINFPVFKLEKVIFSSLSGGIKKIASDELGKKMELKLDLKEKIIAASIFHYLVTPSGGKVSYIAADLFKLGSQYLFDHFGRKYLEHHNIKIEIEDVKNLLDKLSDSSSSYTTNEERYCILCSVLFQEERQYEIFHDMLAMPILEWREKFIEEASQEINESKEKEILELNNKIKQLEKRSIIRNCVNKILKDSIPYFSNNKIRQEEIESLLARQAYRFNKDYELDWLVEIDSALRQALSTDYFSSILYDANPNANRKDISSVAVSQDGQWLATGSYDGIVRVWDLHQRGSSPINLESSDEEKIFTSTAFSKDSKILAVGREDGTVQLWEQNNTEAKWINIKTFTAHTGVGRVNVPGEADKQPEVRAIAFCTTTNLTLLATGSWDSTVCLWDLDNLDTPLATLPHDDWIWSVAFSPDGQTLAAGCRNGTVRLWKLDQPNFVPLLLAKAKLYRFLLQPFQNYSIFLKKDLVLHEDEDWRNRDNQYRWDRQVFAVAFHPQNSNILAAGSWDGKLRVWRLSHPNSVPEILPGQEEMQMEKDAVRSLAFSPDGQWLIAGRDNHEIWRWEWENPKAKPIKLEKGHTLGVSSLAFTPDSQMFVSGGWDSRVRLWENGQSSVAPTTLYHEDKVRSVAIAGNQLASGSWDKKVRLWNLNQLDAPPMILGGQESEVFSVAFDSEGKQLVSASYDKTVRLWDCLAGKCLKTFTQHEGEVMSVAFSPDGETVALGSDDQKVRLRNVKTGEYVKELTQHQGKVRAVAFSPGGQWQWLASGSYDNTLRLWNAKYPYEELVCLPIPEGDVTAIAFSRDSEILAVGTETPIVLLWDLKPLRKGGDPNFLCQVKDSGDKKISSIAFGSDPDLDRDNQILATGNQEGTVELWKVQELLHSKSKAKPIVLNEKKHTDWIRSLAFSEDGKTLASASDDSTILLWKVNTKELADIVCQKVWRNLTQEEWNKFVRGEENIPYEPTCPYLPSGESSEGIQSEFELKLQYLSPRQQEILQVIKDQDELTLEQIMEKLALTSQEKTQTNLQSLCQSNFLSEVSGSESIRYKLSPNYLPYHLDEKGKQP